MMGHLSEGEVDQVHEVVFPGRQAVQQRVVPAPERTAGVRPGSGKYCESV